jgi:hypothetical protein
MAAETSTRLDQRDAIPGSAAGALTLLTRIFAGRMLGFAESAIHPPSRTGGRSDERSAAVNLLSDAWRGLMSAPQRSQASSQRERASEGAPPPNDPNVNRGRPPPRPDIGLSRFDSPRDPGRSSQQASRDRERRVGQSGMESAALRGPTRAHCWPFARPACLASERAPEGAWGSVSEPDGSIGHHRPAPERGSVSRRGHVMLRGQL